MASHSYLLEAFINIGLVPDAGGTYFLVKQLGYSKALELTVEGKPITAAVCKELNLANKVVPSENLMKEAREWAERLADRPLSALWLSKAALRYANDRTLKESLEYEARMQQFLFASEDNVEGIRAFLEKRKAKFACSKFVETSGGAVARL